MLKAFANGIASPGMVRRERGDAVFKVSNIWALDSAQSQFSFSMRRDAFTFACEPPAKAWRPTAAAEE
jgi:hypothetical protein